MSRSLLLLLPLENHDRAPTLYSQPLSTPATSSSSLRPRARSPSPAMSAPPWDYIAKLVCIGDSGCGKSSLTIRLCEGRFSPQHDVTIGVEFGSRIVPVGPPHSKTLQAAAAADRRAHV